MHERAEPLQSPLVSLDQERDREFEAHLTETSTLAFRVAFSVLRQQQDAEDVAQEAFTRAWCCASSPGVPCCSALRITTGSRRESQVWGRPPR